ncbi:MAG: hydantoinase B/oxoprolinase family protein, partial [Dehalococcoidia bacterium]|nr:hydantoinase B/oxoprolinase family protein [Dehalococcoidia bacterium]
ERLVFDFTGTSPQVEGPVNCTRVGLEGGVFSAVLPALCYDMAWSPAALKSVIEIVAEDGLINTARYPAAVSMATVAATFATQHVSSAAIAKLLASSRDPRYRLEAQANWTPTWQGTTLAGWNHRGERITGVLLDQAGGGGASGDRDGIDTAGVPGSPSMGIGNVETYERQYPILYVYRKQGRDTGGAGRFRGGMGTEILMVPWNHQGPLDVTVLTHGASQPEARGLFGGGPSSIQVRLLLRETNLVDRFRNGALPTSLEEIDCRLTEALEAKDRTMMHERDALLVVAAGGGGYGDPLERPAERVFHDHLAGVISPETTRNLYGVVLGRDGTAVDLSATEQCRQALRTARLREGTPADPDAVRPAPRAPGDLKPVSLVDDCLSVVESGRDLLYACTRCDHLYGPLHEDPKRYALLREVTITAWSEWNRYGLVGDVKIVEFYCPGCGLMIGVQVRKKEDPPLWDLSLRAPAT